jgi:hypothetical protein
MKFNNQGAFTRISLFFLLFSFGCGHSSTSKLDESVVANLPNGSVLTSVGGANVMKMTVNGSLCGSDSDDYPNKPCVSVTVCNSDGSNCTVVNDILVDTGSYGLRIFKTAVPNLTITPITAQAGGQLTECAKFGDGTSQWGPVILANVVLASENPITVPMQIIDPAFGKAPTTCGDIDASAEKSGFNGVLGVGLLAYDCGDACLGTHSANGTYFSCSAADASATCVGATTATLADQVQNPVTLLPVDNNGVILELPSLPLGGAPSADGYVILGIGTQANNIPSKVTKYAADPAKGEFVTTIGGVSYPSFLDSGSNAVYFPTSENLPLCDPGNSPWYCPDTTENLSAVITASDGSNKVTVNDYVGNALGLFGDNDAFIELAGEGVSTVDWGMPFFFGRNVYVGFENKKSSLGTGPFWAF